MTRIGRQALVPPTPTSEAASAVMRANRGLSQSSRLDGFSSS